MSRQLFTKPSRSNLSPARAARRASLALLAGKTSDIRAGYDHFTSKRMTAVRVTSK